MNFFEPLLSSTIAHSKNKLQQKYCFLNKSAFNNKLDFFVNSDKIIALILLLNVDETTNQQYAIKFGRGTAVFQNCFLVYKIFLKVQITNTA